MINLHPPSTPLSSITCVRLVQALASSPDWILSAVLQTSLLQPFLPSSSIPRWRASSFQPNK